MTIKLQKNISVVFCLVALLFFAMTSKAQERPFIWVDNDERQLILNKIEQQPWAAEYYTAFIARIDADVEEHTANVTAFLKKMPLDIDAAKKGVSPPLKQVDYSNRNAKSVSKVYQRYLMIGIDCGVAYYLTQDEIYAQCALDILNVLVVGLNQLDLDENTRAGGWLYTNGEHLREAREIGAQIPIVYDFVAPYITKGGQPYDLGAQGKVDFPYEAAQNVFRTYAKLAVERGMTGSNWSVLEAPSMVQNLMAIDDEQERDALLEVYLTEGSPLQDPLSVIAEDYEHEGDVYPETSQYSSGVASYCTYMMTIITKYKPDLHLGQKYKNIQLSLYKWEDMKYPNGDIVSFGDGHRHGGINYNVCEVAYYLSTVDDVSQVSERSGQLINTAISEEKYSRGDFGRRTYGASVYFQPLELLWNVDQVQGSVKDREQTRTDQMRHASLFLQRNLSTTQQPEDGLMCFVGGAHMVHGHANGMDMELYGKGYVLGVDNGRKSYRTELHENYSRLFAAHNTVIVNGSSQSEGGWVGLGINSVELVAMEPKPREEAISPDFSFTQTSFIDDKGDKAEAKQLRTMALIRTSPTSGYYYDMYRSKSSLSNEYHDYVYHNIGDKVEILNKDVALAATPERYMANAHLPWVANRKFRHPGWHYFKEVFTSPVYETDILLRFTAKKLSESKVGMNLLIPGEMNREYTTVMAPTTFEGPEPYNKKTTPTFLMRQKGEAWNHPFVVAYEPIINSETTVKSIQNLVVNDRVVGSVVISELADKTITDYIIAQDKLVPIVLSNQNIEFDGRFAIVRIEQQNGEEKVQLYIGDGNTLTYKDQTLEADAKQHGWKIVL